tara:strand:- start:1807 stop:1926 length:120 start_codon:yes stop_codon:yes gene_type:complete
MDAHFEKTEENKSESKLAKPNAFEYKTFLFCLLPMAPSG